VRELSVLIVDDHALFADALRIRLLRERDLHPVYVAYSANEVRARMATTPVDVVLLDVMLGDANGLDLIAHIRNTSPGTRLVMLTGVDSVSSVVAALRGGARAWLPKTVDTDHLVRVIRGVCRDEAWLSPDLLGSVLTDLLAPEESPVPDPLRSLTTREAEVLQCMVDGLTRVEIAHRLRVSVNTVRTHTQNLLSKLGAHSTLESVAVALRHGVRASAE
jgi:DNA-binding NarL/FixJ family response regulator